MQTNWIVCFFKKRTIYVNINQQDLLALLSGVKLGMHYYEQSYFLFSISDCLLELQS